MEYDFYITLFIIAGTVAASVWAWQRPRVMERMIYWPPAVARGEYWRLVTHGFIHADGTHLAFNMITLFFFGMAMERVLVPAIGVLGFVAFYLAGIVLAILPTHLRHRDNRFYRSLGASGAVSAVLFAYILLQPWSMLFVFFIPMPAIVFAAAYVAYSFWAQRQARDNVNHSAHLWGGAWGVGFMLLLEPALFGRFFQELLSPLGG
ncbi:MULTISPECIES: rhomboid family intramembrane serine protease [unclassified Thioalkalivibrio]|uniref:rhomboid family intramembrane serine protease n=1 Tax=unclassified Thioalkalivibrio TaxID=2621013 RepID=UPI00037F828D|nr:MULTISPECIES: rhomboid family intramembrane serine protease [unclassified Thioalkalivibrio]